MINCPKCNQSLPDWSQSCQFCGTDVKTVARPAPVQKKVSQVFITPQWVWVAYYAIALWWILGGAYDVMDAMYLFGKPLALLKLEREVGVVSGPNIVGIVAGAVTCLFGIGLALKIELIRGIVNFFAGLKLLFALLGLAGSLLGMSFSGALGLVFVIMNIIDIVTSGALIFLIGETDMKANI